MVYTTEYASPLGPITLACDGEAIIGLWFNGQRYFGNILPEQRIAGLYAEDLPRVLGDDDLALFADLGRAENMPLRLAQNMLSACHA